DAWQPLAAGQRPLVSVAGRRRSRAQHDRIGTRFPDIVSRHFGPELHADLQFLELVRIPVADQLADLAAHRLPGGKPELAAQFGLALDQRHAVTALGGDARNFEAGRTATDHENVPWPVAARHDIAAPFEFAAGRRVCETRHPGLAQAPCNAKLVAGNAGPY